MLLYVEKPAYTQFSSAEPAYRSIDGNLLFQTIKYKLTQIIRFIDQACASQNRSKSYKDIIIQALKIITHQYILRTSYSFIQIQICTITQITKVPDLAHVRYSIDSKDALSNDLLPLL